MDRYIGLDAHASSCTVAPVAPVAPVARRRPPFPVPSLFGPKRLQRVRSDRFGGRNQRSHHGHNRQETR